MPASKVDQNDFYYQKTSWQAHAESLSSIRQQVFINEQGVADEEEWDGLDEKAIHYLVCYQQQAVACARVYYTDDDSAKIGRVAVLAPFRRKGIAKALMRFIIDDMRNTGIRHLKLDAQLYVIPLYQQMGFRICSDAFLDAGIMHRSMQMELT